MKPFSPILIFVGLVVCPAFGHHKKYEALSSITQAKQNLIANAINSKQHFISNVANRKQQLVSNIFNAKQNLISNIAHTKENLLHSQHHPHQVWKIHKYSGIELRPVSAHEVNHLHSNHKETYETAPAAIKLQAPVVASPANTYGPPRPADTYEPPAKSEGENIDPNAALEALSNLGAALPDDGLSNLPYDKIVSLYNGLSSAKSGIAHYVQYPFRKIGNIKAAKVQALRSGYQTVSNIAGSKFGKPVVITESVNYKGIPIRSFKRHILSHIPIIGQKLSGLSATHPYISGYGKVPATPNLPYINIPGKFKLLSAKNAGYLSIKTPNQVPEVPASSYGPPAPSTLYGAPEVPSISYGIPQVPSKYHGVPSTSSIFHTVPSVPSSYEAPSTSYGAPSTSYGAPSTSYGAPSSSYGASSSSFNAPTAQSSSSNSASASSISHTVPSVSSSHEAPSTSYGAPSNSYGVPSTSYEAPSTSYEAHPSSFNAPPAPSTSYSSGYQGVPQSFNTYQGQNDLQSDYYNSASGNVINVPASVESGPQYSFPSHSDYLTHYAQNKAYNSDASYAASEQEEQWKPVDPSGEDSEDDKEDASSAASAKEFNRVRPAKDAQQSEDVKHLKEDSQVEDQVRSEVKKHDLRINRRNNGVTESTTATASIQESTESSKTREVTSRKPHTLEDLKNRPRSLPTILRSRESTTERHAVSQTVQEEVHNETPNGKS